MQSVRLRLGLLLALGLILMPSTTAQPDYVYQNLMKSRDALLSQQAELQRVYDETRRQMDVLNARMTKIEAYMRQVNSSLRDVEDAIRKTK